MKIRCWQNFQCKLRLLLKQGTMRNIFANIKRILHCICSFVWNYNTTVIHPIIKELVSSVSSLLVLWDKQKNIVYCMLRLFIKYLNTPHNSSCKLNVPNSRRRLSLLSKHIMSISRNCFFHYVELKQKEKCWSS